MYNAVHELSCHITMTSKLHYNAMLTKINYCVGTTNWGLFLKPTSNWGRKGNAFELVIHGQSDFDCARNPEIVEVFQGQEWSYRDVQHV